MLAHLPWINNKENTLLQTTRTDLPGQMQLLSALIRNGDLSCYLDDSGIHIKVQNHPPIMLALSTRPNVKLHLENKTIGFAVLCS